MKRLVEVYVARNLPDAYVVKGGLEDAGLEVTVMNEPLQSAAGELGLGWATAPRLLVDASVAERAAEVIRSLRTSSRTSGPPTPLHRNRGGVSSAPDRHRRGELHMTPEQQDARRKRLVSGARALLSLQVGIAFGCMRMNRLLHDAGVPLDDQPGVFRRFLAAATDLPLANERLKWETNALLAGDAQLTLVESEFRPAILAACVDIIARYDAVDSPPQA